MKNILNNKKGFSLIEVTSILLVISVGLIGVLTLINQNIQVQNINKNNLIGHQLAQEGVEVVRGARDINWKNGDAFNLGLDAGNYIVDFLTTTPVLLSGSIASNLDKITLQMPTSGSYANMYIHNQTYNDTIFRRYVTITQPDTYILDVVVTVSWEDRNKTKTYKAETILYDWR